MINDSALAHRFEGVRITRGHEGDFRRKGLSPRGLSPIDAPFLSSQIYEYFVIAHGHINILIFVPAIFNARFVEFDFSRS